MKSSGFKPNPKMSHGSAMGGDGRKHKRIEKAKYAEGGTVTYSKKEPKFGGGRLAGKVTNKLPRVNEAPGELYLGGSRNFDESRPGLVKRAPIGGGISGGPTKLPKGQTPPGGGGISGGPMRRNPPALGKLPIGRVGNLPARMKKGGMTKGRKGC